MIEFRVLGPVQVWRDGTQVPLDGVMQRRLLAALLVRAPRPVSTDELIDQLWFGHPPRTGRKTLQVYVRRLRKALGPHRIAFQPGTGYALAGSVGRLDAQQFDELVSTAVEARRRGEFAPAGSLLRQGLSLWRGEPYCDVADLPILAEQCGRLQERRLLALEARLATDIDLGRHDEAIGELAGLSHRNPYREQLWSLLMLALHRANRRAEALAVYRTAHATLAEELGLEPSSPLQWLHRAILNGDPLLRRVHTLAIHVAGGMAEPERFGAEPVPADHLLGGHAYGRWLA